MLIVNALSNISKEVVKSNGEKQQATNAVLRLCCSRF